MIASTYTEILSRIEANDSTAVTLLYKRYGRQLYQYAHVQWSLDEDAIWEVIYQTLEQLQLRLLSYQFENQTMFDRLVFKVFLNFLRQRYRKEHQASRLTTVPLLEVYPDEAQTELNDQRQRVITDWLIDSQSELCEPAESESPLLGKLQRALDQLEPLERDLLLLRAQEFSYDEIAQMLGTVNNQLKVKHLRAKKKLINLINQLV
ncbi:RNA polymerase sigma factor [Spirosoma pollinicola]|uniref:RNA polymerase sigma factor 70 region 4 type 2 domain-containing protein n=1 Tax=Spirosoma pollinicola TaxID=2057025 RepID=A0A2K8Z2B5_9BACT|nr:sigma factor-like helix-turn-helix DNA-binding protein [Spirosoma pollinicola]AUD04020.1 hypothetical protein CWM47_20630 [Spirosoma pollinicola]